MDLEKSFRVALAMKGITKKELAKELKCTSAYVTQISKGGSISVRKLQDICSALDIKVWEFIKLGDE